MEATPSAANSTTNNGIQNSTADFAGIDVPPVKQHIVDFICSEYCQPTWQQYQATVHEPDEYSETAIQLGVLRSNEVLGAVRLIPGEHNQITNKLPIFTQPGWVELSRLVVHHQHRGNSAILFTLLMEAHRAARENGFTHFIAAINKSSEKIFRAFRFSYTSLKQDAKYFGQSLNVVTWEIAAAEARLRNNKLFDPDSLSRSLTVYRSR